MDAIIAAIIFNIDSVFPVTGVTIIVMVKIALASPRIAVGDVDACSIVVAVTVAISTAVRRPCYIHVARVVCACGIGVVVDLHLLTS
jgi:hypothetical protein